MERIDNEKSVYVDLDSARVWYDKQQGGIRLILNGSTIINLRKESPQYNKVMNEIVRLQDAE
ncbi:hypothetical protein MOC96_12060 [Bacillus vallismortis]|uniref:hypothetical protein n=1 Tax=Bacillus vallismortis TaxID=72361 RepID=UPI00227F76E3|nr:hypothetical protein [Bacillus vallismortis]MCY8309459.1 hypothetical protein [Bacillus vallismortis]